MVLNRALSITILAVVVLVVFSFNSALYVIPEGRQAVITQFGRPVETVKNAGLHFKMPLIQDVRMIDLRILSWDGFPNQIPTKDKKYIEVDTTARWKITDPLKFIQTVQNERGARSRLDAILDGFTRDVISGHNLVEAVRNSNKLNETLEKLKKEVNEADSEESKLNEIVKEEEVVGDIEKVNIGRERLSELIIEGARKELRPLGIELIDVQLKRISYENSVQQKVYLRMISERERIASKIRSFGKGEEAKIVGKTDKDLKEIQSKAYRKVQNIKGEAESKSISIYAEAFNKSPDFYRYIRTLRAYENSLSDETKLLLSSESKFWRVLHQGRE